MTNTEIINNIHEIMANEKMITVSEGIYGEWLRTTYVLDPMTESGKKLFSFLENVVDFIWNEVSANGNEYFVAENEAEKEIEITIFTPEYYEAYTGRKF